MGSRHLSAWEFWAPRYEYLVSQPFSLKPTRDLVVKRVAEACPGARRILDAGCGIGQLAVALAERLPDVRVVGVDPTGAMIHRARADYAHPHVAYLLGTVDDVPDEVLLEGNNSSEAQGGFDAVVSTHAFPYVRNPQVFLARIRDLLRPGGRLFLAQVCTESWWDSACLRAIALATGPATFHSSRELERMVVEAGLRLDGVAAIPVLPLVPSLRLVEAVK